MKMRLILGTLVLLSAGLITHAAVQDDGGEAEMMKRWMEYMTPGDPHARLATGVGEWTFTSEMWMDPSAPPQKGSGTASAQMIMGGRYLVEDVKGTMMGMPYEGKSTVGYDNMLKRYFSTWIDSMGTGLTSMHGIEKGKKITFKGMMPDAMAGKEIPLKLVETKIDENHRQLEMFGTGPDGKEMLTMKMVYTRVDKKSGN